MEEIAYDFYERSLTIDLGEYMHSSDEGIHSASLGGVWESTVMGFGGVRIHENLLRIAPKLPKAWKQMTFSLCYQGCRLKVTAGHEKAVVQNQGEKQLTLFIGTEKTVIETGAQVEKALN